VDAFQQMGGRDVAHVEGRVLAHQDHILRRKVDALAFAQREVVALLVAHRHGVAAGKERAVAAGQRIHMIVEQAVAAALRLQHEGEGGIACDVDRRDGVHLDRNGKSHDLTVSVECILDVCGPEVRRDGDDVKPAVSFRRAAVAGHPCGGGRGDALGLPGCDREHGVIHVCPRLHLDEGGGCAPCA
jgi:hypothetical protein